MKKLFSIIVLVLILLSIYSYAETINGKFVRFTGNSIVVKTENDILTLPISKDIVVFDSKGEKVSSASLFENANVTINYQDGMVKSITIDKENINYNLSTTKPEYQLFYKSPTYQYTNIQVAPKVSYVGYLPVDYQIIKYPLVDVNKGTINYYTYQPVRYSNIETTPIANNINFYNNLLANNYMSERYYYEVSSSVSGSQIPNYYYIAKVQENSPYYYKINPTNDKYDNNYYYANINNKTQDITTNNQNIIRGRLTEINNDLITVASDKNYRVLLDSTSNIFVKKNGKVSLLSNKEELKNLLNKNVEVNISLNNNQLVASTILIETQ